MPRPYSQLFIVSMTTGWMIFLCLVVALMSSFNFHGDYVVYKNYIPINNLESKSLVFNSIPTEKFVA